jgi:hypothetical protein
MISTSGNFLGAGLGELPKTWIPRFARNDKSLLGIKWFLALVTARNNMVFRSELDATFGARILRQAFLRQPRRKTEN